MANTVPVYLDCAATTPLEPAVRDVLVTYLTEEFGNEGSRTHIFGTRAKQAVQAARDQVARVVGCQREEVVFTSGATESNNLALLGLENWASKTGKRHILSTQIEHKAVLGPLEELSRRGFEVEYLQPGSTGAISAVQVINSLRPDTALVSVMHANNETGVIQPIDEIAGTLKEHPAYFHVDAAQTFGKILLNLKNQRIDLISASGHKIFGPKGIGALITRRRGYNKVPLSPLHFGGGQERGLRPGTLPVALIVAFGKAAQLAVADNEQRIRRCQQVRTDLRAALAKFDPKIHGDEALALPNVINMSFSGADSEAVMLAVKEHIAISNGSACTSANYTQSHVLEAMQVAPEEIKGAVRFSWCHLTPDIDWTPILHDLEMILPRSPHS